MPACLAPKRAAGLADARHQASSSGVSDEQSKVCPLARARPLLPSVCAARWRRAHSLCACALRRCVQLEPCSPVSSPSSLPATRVADAHGHDRRSRCRCRRTTRRSAARALEGCATDILQRASRLQGAVTKNSCGWAFGSLAFNRGRAGSAGTAAGVGCEAEGVGAGVSRAAGLTVLRQGSARRHQPRRAPRCQLGAQRGRWPVATRSRAVRRLESHRHRARRRGRVAPP